MIVRELITKLGFSVNDANLRKYEGSINNIKSSAENAANSFRNMFAAFVGFSALKSIANTADQMQSMQARIGMLPQTIGEAGDAFDVVGNRATAARQSIDAYGNLYIKLQNAGKDFIKTQAEGLQVTDTLSKALVVGGASAQEQSSAMLQFAQAIGSGVLQGDELRAMGEAAPQFMDELAKAIGVPRDQIKKMGSEGKLTSKIIIEAVKKMSSVFDEKFKQMPMTISQAITIGGNRWAMFINNLNRKSGTVTSIANFLLDGFDKLEDGLNSVVKYFGGATNAVKIFGIVIGAALAPLIGGLFLGALSALLSPMTLVVAGLALIGVAIEDFYTWMRGGDSYFGDWLGNFDDMKVKFDEIVAKIVSLKGIAQGLFWLWGMGWIGMKIVMGESIVVMIAKLYVFAAAWISTHYKMAVAAIAAFAPYAAVAAALTAVVLVIWWLYDNWKNVTDLIYGIATLNFDKVAESFKKMIDRLEYYWTSFKSFFSLGASTTIDAKTASGAASAAGGVQMSRPQNAKQEVTIQQSFPAGTGPEIMSMAREGALQGMNAVDNGPLSRQMGQAQ